MAKGSRSLPKARAEDPADLLKEGFAALADGELDTAEARFSAAIAAEANPAARAIEALGVCQLRQFAWVEARQTMEQAFTAYLDEGDMRRAILAGANIVTLCEAMGETAAARGWEQRSLRLAKDVGPCAERGYLALARLGCDVRDAGILEESADLALALALEFKDRDLEIRALADKGLALVSRGHVEEGFALQDEVMVRLDSGEVKNSNVVGSSLCSMLAACERAGDLSRADDFCARIEHLIVFPAAHTLHCRVTYGSVLAMQGRWESAEASLLDAARISGPYTRRRDYARTRLADMRIQQGREAEAAELLNEKDESGEVASVIAKLRFVQGRLDDSVSLLRSAARSLRHDRLRVAPVLSLMVKVELSRGDMAGARTAVKHLDKLHEECDSNEIRAMARLGAGRIAIEAGDPGGAVDELDTALTLLVHTERPMLAAEIRLEFARALQLLGDSTAKVEAEAALATFQKLGAVSDAAQARNLSDEVEHSARSAGPAPRHMAGMVEVLTKREAEVAGLVASGLTNREMADRLFLSVRTVECHVDRVLGKMNLRSRTQVGANAVSLGRSKRI